MSDQEKAAINKQILEENIKDIAKYFGGVVEVFNENRNESDDIPPNIKMLVETLTARQVPSEYLIKYSSSPILWEGITFDSNGMQQAIERDQPLFFEWIRTWQKVNDCDYLTMAIRSNRIKSVKYFSERDNTANFMFNNIKYLVQKAFVSGYVEIVQYLCQYYDYELDITESIYNDFCYMGHPLEIHQWAATYFQPTKDSINIVCSIGQTDVVNWMNQYSKYNGVIYFSTIKLIVIKNLNETFFSVIKNGMAIIDDNVNELIEIAADHYNIPVIQYLKRMVDIDFASNITKILRHVTLDEFVSIFDDMNVSHKSLLKHIYHSYRSDLMAYYLQKHRNIDRRLVKNLSRGLLVTDRTVFEDWERTRMDKLIKYY